MDYVNSRRIKLWGTAHFFEDDDNLLEQLRDSDYGGKAERVILFSMKAWDVNCPLHIHKRVPQTAVSTVIEQLRTRVSQLESTLPLNGAPN